MFHHCLGSLFGLIVWNHCLEALSEITVWDHCLGSLSGIIVWDHCLESLSRIIVWNHCLESLSGTIVWNCCLRSLFGIIVLAHCLSLRFPLPLELKLWLIWWMLSFTIIMISLYQCYISFEEDFCSYVGQHSEEWSHELYREFTAGCVGSFLFNTIYLKE